MKVTPFGNRYLVEQDRAEASKHGLAAPDDMEEQKRPIGTVGAVGSGVTDDFIKVGDRVMFSELSGQPVTAVGKVFILLEASQVQLKIEDL